MKDFLKLINFFFNNNNENDDDILVDLLGLPYKITGSATDRSVFGEIQKNHFFEYNITKIISNLLKEGDIFVDIGANIGYYLLHGSYLVGNTGMVFGFEPIPKNFEYCKKNVKLNHLKNVVLYKNALWNEKTEKKMISPEGLPGNSQILISGDGIVVNCITLDSMEICPDLIKMDIEGAEPFALQGMRKTITTCKPKLVLEMNRLALRNGFNLDVDSYWAFFQEMNYTINVINPDSSLTKINSLEELTQSCSPDLYVDLLAEPN
jgi:FkbM family methyltransferase